MGKEIGGISLHKDDWSLHRKGPIDQARHNEKVKEAIRGNLGDVMTDDAIITSDGKTTIKVPVKSIALPRFRFDERRLNHVGQGDGKSDVGDVIDQSADGTSSGKGHGAGNEPGIDYYETQITIDELAGLVFEDLGLPNLEPKQNPEIPTETIRINGLNKKGPMSKLDKRRTAMTNITRHAINGEKRKFHGIKPDDLRFRTWEEEEKKSTNAVVIAMRDVSGSMGEFEKYISRVFYFWMVRFLRTKYDNTRIVFITHHAEAKEVQEQEFFTQGESGGTKASSAYQLALDIIKERFDPERWNIYPFHFSDGDNWGESDNKTCIDLVSKLKAQSSMMGYGEIQKNNHGHSTLMSVISGLVDNKLTAVTIREKADVYPALQKFFSLDDTSNKAA